MDTKNYAKRKLVYHNRARRRDSRRRDVLRLFERLLRNVMILLRLPPNFFVMTVLLRVRFTLTFVGFRRVLLRFLDFPNILPTLPRLLLVSTVLTAPTAALAAGVISDAIKTYI